MLPLGIEHRAAAPRADRVARWDREPLYTQNWSMTKLLKLVKRNRRDDNDRWPPGSGGYSLRVSYAF